MAEITPLSIDRFLLIYLLLLIILMIMKKCKIRQSRLLLLGSLQMTVQLVLAGWLQQRRTAVHGHVCTRHDRLHHPPRLVKKPRAE